MRARKQMLEGYVLLKEENFPEAAARLAQAAQSARAAPAPDIESQTQMLLGQLRAGQQQFDTAEDAFREALRLADGAGDLYHQAAALLNLGVIEIQRNRHDHALPVFQRSLILAEQADARLLATTAAANMSLCHSRLGNYEEAIRSRRRCLEIQRRAGVRKHELASLGELATIYLDQGNAAEAVRWFREAVELARALKSRSEEIAWGSRLANALVEAGELDEAGRIARGILDSSGDRGSQNNALYTLARIDELRGAHGSAIERYSRLALSPDTRPALLWSAHAGMARTWSRAGNPVKARKEYEAALNTIERARSELLRTDYKLGFLTALIRFYRDYVDDLLRGGDPVGALAVADSSRAQVMSARGRAVRGQAAASRKMEPKRVAAALDAVILSYWVAPDRSYLWAINHDSIQRFDLPGERQLLELITAYRQMLERELRDPLAPISQTGSELYRLLVAPAEGMLPEGSRVIVIPDGPLHSLNFETLISPRPHPGFWLEHVTVSVAPSIGALSPIRSSAAAKQSLMLIGAPETAGTEWEELPFAGLELTRIASHFPRAQKLVKRGAAATPSAFLKAHPERYSLIHFSTHALANRENPLDSAIILAPENGAHRLFSRDIANLRLGADLVTVSACRSAGARTYSGEGLVGFAWAFLEAGAKNVIAGLWDVNDRSTAELMDRLYARLAAGAEPSSALREAKLSLMRVSPNYRKPYYWAPFQLYTRSAEASGVVQASKTKYSH